jgi:cellulose synthase/poly-beta-1,6-N-acetylglucosamine synthase-like glycosyltransferase
MMHLVLLLCGVALVAVTLPLVLELAMVTSANLLPAPAQLTGVTSTLRLAVIVPAHNEQLLVTRCVASLLNSSGAGATVFVVAHNSSDATAVNARAAGAEVLVYNDLAAKGKGFALRHGFEHALGLGYDAVLVVDADSIVTPNTITVVRSALAAGARVVQCRYEMVSTTERSATRLSALAFRAFNVIRPRGRETLGLSAGIVGNGFAIVRNVLERIPYDAFSVVEDLEYHLHLVMAGERVRYLGHAMISADFPESRAGEAVQRSRWEGGRLHTARKLTLPMLGQMLAGRFRLFEPLCDLAGMPMGFAAFALVVAVCLPLTWLRWYAAMSLVVILCHVIAAAWAGPDFWQTMKLLALVPLYILRKIWNIPGVLRGSSSKADWVRTERNNTL